MNNQVYYRKYRPGEFKDVVGQEHIVRVLKNAVERDRVAHAYLFSGPRGTGKTTCARILARTAGCEPEDILEIDAASQRGIDEARALREGVQIVPLRSPRKAYIIDEVHMLTREAFNALLKTIEEPPAHAMFILATTERAKVPDTIVSRTQHFEFGKISIPHIVQELQTIAKKESLAVDDDALKLIAFFADGSLRDASNILFQVVSLGTKKITEDDVRLLLGAPQEEIINHITEHVLSRASVPALAAFDQIIQSGVDPQLAGRLILRNLRAVYFASLDPASVVLKREFADSDIAFFASCAAATQNTHLDFAVREMLSALAYRADDHTAHIPIELALIKIATHS